MEIVASSVAYLRNEGGGPSYNPCNNVAVAICILGGRMQDHIKPYGSWPEVDGGRESGVDNRGQAVIFAEGSNRSEVSNLQLRVGDSLNIECLHSNHARWDKARGKRALFLYTESTFTLAFEFNKNS